MRTIHLTDVDVNYAVRLRDFFLFDYRFDHDCNIEVDERFIKSGCLILEFTFYRTADQGRFVIDFIDGSARVHFTVLPSDDRDYLEEKISSVETSGEFCETIKDLISKLLDSSSLFDCSFGRPDWKRSFFNNDVLPSLGTDTHQTSQESIMRDRASVLIDFYPVSSDRGDFNLGGVTYGME